ncbi:MAG TPA: hypothetical protein VK983_01685 [Candidatus Limnocylindrales bacterium]|nr:hypothetical protein [Candidatus Limnocylindrales bacterium]
MEFSPASQPYKIEPYEPLPLTTEQVKDVVCAYEQGERLPSNITEQFLETPPEEGALDRIGKRMAALPTALLAGHIATETMV